MFRLQDGPNNLGLVSFPFVIGRATVSVTNTGGITINDNSRASPYPSTLTVSNVVGTVSKVTATLYNVNHSYPDDVDVLLVSPLADKVILMSDAGTNGILNNVRLTFDDMAKYPIPDNLPITASATNYIPANYEPTKPDSFPTNGVNPPSLLVPPYRTTMSTFNGKDPNGTWY